MAPSRPYVTIYTDGGAEPNPGPGGWAAILIDDKTHRIRELSGAEPDTTNNRMELLAAVKALEALKQPCEVRFFTDSEYLRRGITQWLTGWAAAGWRRSSGQLRNADLWQLLDTHARRHEISWEWIKGHAGDRHNARADRLATQARRAGLRDLQAAEEVNAEVFLRSSCVGGKGGWAAIIRDSHSERILSGHLSDTTSNQLDLMAAVAALRALPDRTTIRVWSGSGYLRHGASRRLEGWRTRHWRKADGSSVKHRDLWAQLDTLLATRVVTWQDTKDAPSVPAEHLETVARREAEQA